MGGGNCLFKMSLIGVVTPLVENLYFILNQLHFHKYLLCLVFLIFKLLWGYFFFKFVSSLASSLKTTSGCEISSWQWGEVALYCF